MPRLELYVNLTEEEVRSGSPADVSRALCAVAAHILGKHPDNDSAIRLEDGTRVGQWRIVEAENQLPF